jgi:type IV pilus assembly protein PilB
LAAAGFPEGAWDGIEELFRSVGCQACSGTGFRGRVGVYEVMQVSETIERMTVELAPSDDVRKVAEREGMVSMGECGLLRAAEGVTSVEEVLRVVA